MFIDAHTHIGFGGAYPNATPEKLIASMDEAGIHIALVIASPRDNCDTRVLTDAIRPYGNRLFAAAYGFPAQSIAVLENLLWHKEVVAVKFYPGYEWFFPADHSIRPHLELCRDYNVPAIFHQGDCLCHYSNTAKLKFAHPLALDELAAEMPDLTIVMAHQAQPWIVDGAEVVYSKKNVYADCSGFVCGSFTTQQRELFVENFRYFWHYIENPEKVLFGTDWPISNQGSYMEVMEQAMRGVDAAHWDLVFAQNARRLFRLPR